MRDLFDIFNITPSDPDPVRRAQIQMHRPLPKRFYTDVTVVAEEGGGFGIRLDGKSVRTPARAILKVPTRALADNLKAEWEAQEELIDPAKMPATRLVNTALDAVADKVEAVAGEIVAYAGTDMLCYRADSPDGLVLRQQQSWDPLLSWVAETHGARFVLAEGIIHRQQPGTAIEALEAALKPFATPIAISCLHTMTTLTGSAVLALALAEGRVMLDEAWRVAHLEEDWTIEHWGSDPEAEARREKRFAEMRAAYETLVALGAT